ncbi:cellulase family glycosylhydrolase [Algicola sagamiensis]|uniref:cellulase family glycosylhydrolase n=1 Tax=Algicola sagamiensis TaxID=163869 RepID=UPI0003A6E1E0|nr:cellulase family glycosylhydrolase [Algicola sagamiensis]
MYHITLLLMFLFVFLPITLCYASVLKAPNTPVATHKQLSVCGTHLCNHENKPIQLVGMSTHGLQWYGWGKCLTAKSLDVLAEDWEVDIVRLSLYVQEGGYESDPEGFTQQVQWLINAVSQRGLYVLIDWHQLTPGDPNFNLSLAKRFFKDIVQANAHRNNLLYDIANEPNGVTWQAIYRYANEMIPWIRQYDKKAPILVGTHGWSTFGLSDGQSLQDILSLPIPYDNIMYIFIKPKIS